MAGIDHGAPGQRQNFFADAGKKLVAVASRKIPASDAIGKKDVPAIELAGGGKIKAKASRTVARNQQEFGVGPGGGNGAGFLQ